MVVWIKSAVPNGNLSAKTESTNSSDIDKLVAFATSKMSSHSSFVNSRINWYSFSCIVSPSQELYQVDIANTVEYRSIEYKAPSCEPSQFNQVHPYLSAQPIWYDAPVSHVPSFPYVFAIISSSYEHIFIKAELILAD